MNTSFQVSDEILRGAGELYRSGRAAEAETACQRILSSNPRHAGALHLLGVIVGRKGDLNGAVNLVAQAVSELPELVAAHLTLGQLYVSLRDLPKAIVSFQRVAALRPNDPQNWYSLGIVQRMNKNSSEAIASFQKALALDPEYAEAHIELGALLRLKGRFAEALESFTTAVAARPNSAEFQNNVAAALMDVGRLEEAEAAFRRAIQLEPTGAVYHANLGDFFVRSDSYEKALQAYTAAIGLDPRLARGYAGRGRALARMNRFDDSVADQQMALSLAPDDPNIHVLLAWVQTQLGQVAAAEQHCRRALELDNGSAAAWHTLGAAVRAVGRFDEAISCFKRSIELYPSAQVYMLLSATLQNANATEVDRMLAFAQRPELSVEDRSSAEFALGKVLDDLDRFDEAFAHYKIGNELFKELWSRRGITFSLSDYRHNLRAMKQTFAGDFFKAACDWGEQTELPVFIVGMPRSGTSLVEQIAASHSQVFGAGELREIPTYWTELGLAPGPDGRYALDREQVRRVAGEYMKKIVSLGGSATRVIDKMPGNITSLGFIATLFPSARVIFCRRDPRDNCLSCYFQRFAKDNQLFSYDLVDCAHAYREQTSLQAHWQKVLPLRMMTMQYEELIADLEGQSQRLIDFLGLPWESRCLDFHKTDRTVLTSSVWQVRQPIYTRSVGRWKHYERHLGPLLAALGEGVEGNDDCEMMSTEVKSFQASDEAFHAIDALYQAGRIAEAEAACRRVLSGEPRHAGALRLLGVIAARSGDLNGAVKLVAQAVSALPEFVDAHLTLGQLYVTLGDLRRAIASYERVVALQPKHAENWYLLGIVQRMNRNSKQAIASFQTALTLDPRHAEAHVELGALLMLKGQFAEALECFAAAAAARPDSAEFQNNFAAALMEAGRKEDAEAAFRRAIELCPNGAVYHANIGNFFMRSYSYERALQAYATAIGLDPRMARAYAGRGGTLARMNHFDQAIADHQTGLSLAPDDPRIHVSMAGVLMQVGQTAAAERHCRRAVELDNGLAPAWHTLGSVLRAVGRFDEATACFNRSVELCPTAAVYMLLSSTLQDTDASEAERLLAFSRRSDLSVEDRSCAEFALGKLLDDSDRFDEAFAHYKIGNELVKDFWNQRGTCFKLSDYRQTVSAMKQTFTPDFFIAVRDWGEQTELPVFIVGMPRSGTTLIEQIAASHSQVFAAGELRDVSSHWTALGLTSGPNGRYALKPEQVRRAAGEYIKRIMALGGSASRVIDKLPGNITYLGFIAALFPNARVIFCRRDPRDNCLSCYFQRFVRDNQLFSYDLVDCAGTWLEQTRLAAHWQQILPLRMITIQYEDLVADLEGQSRRLIEFLGLPWEPRCVDFHKTDRTVLTASAWQVRQPIYTRSVGRWKHYEKHLGPLLAALGERGAETMNAK